MNIDDAMAMTDELAGLEWTGHVVGDVWKVVKKLANSRYLFSHIGGSGKLINGKEL